MHLPPYNSSQMRNVLKEQIDQVKNPQKSFVATVGESQRAVEMDRSWKSHNQEQEQKHREALVTFRDSNKMVNKNIPMHVCTSLLIMQLILKIMYTLFELKALSCSISVR